MEVGVIVLAAGGSCRLGTPKQLLPFRGTTLLRHAVEAAVASHADHCTVVLGHEAGLCTQQISNMPVQIQANPAWRQGMASSIRAGLEAALRRHPGMDAVILTACDQPHVTAEVLNGLMEAHLGTSSGIVASSYAGTRGIPALFAACWFPQLARLQGDRGAKGLFEAAGQDLSVVPFPGGAVDVDTPLDYASAVEPPLH